MESLVKNSFLNIPNGYKLKLMNNSSKGENFE